MSIMILICERGMETDRIKAIITIGVFQEKHKKTGTLFFMLIRLDSRSE